MYPVGSIYITVSQDLDTAAKVGAALGGTWQAWGAGRVPVGVDASDTDFDTVGETGGEKDHKLTYSEMPRHNHGLRQMGNSSTLSLFLPGDTPAIYNLNVLNITQTKRYDEFGAIVTEYAGSENNKHNNLQPYITCYMYKRTA